jgi:hypothetical protein
VEAGTVVVDPQATISAVAVGFTPVGFAATNPILPGTTADGPPWAFEPVRVLPTGPGRSFPLWFDPDVAIGYRYTVTGGQVETISLTSGFGDDVYDLLLENPETNLFEVVATLLAGETFDVTSISPFGTPLSSGVGAFQIRGIEVGAAVDASDPQAFPTGLTFLPPSGTNVTDGFTPVLTMDPILVPESSALVVLSFLGTVLLRRRR